MLPKNKSWFGRDLYFLIALIFLIIFSLLPFYIFAQRLLPSLKVGGSTKEAKIFTNNIRAEERIKKSLPEHWELKVPFICQAPFANWSIHEDSCEEAAILMAHAYIEGQVLTPEYADKELLAMRQWQREHYGQEKDMSCSEAVQFVRDYYGYKNSRSFNNITSWDIKRQIVQGNLVIVPVMTHSLLNPHYGPKNVYHFVLIKGYNSQGVITNDAGIKEGENYFYPWEVIFSAIDAQTPKMGQGRTMFIMKK